jgi:hypothetical protein
LNQLVKKDRRPHFPDVLRAIGYGHIALWAVLYLFHPSAAVAASTADYSRIIWVGIAGLGAFVAFLGALSGLDVKVELPGILFAAVGPLFYSVINLYFFLFPQLLAPTEDPYTRLALSAFYVSLTLLLLPRAVDLYSEGLRTRNLNKFREKEAGK